jgi:hypothetical protein
LAYGLHPSKCLRSLFGARPFQGADPSTARFLFFGLDANFAADVESSASFQAVCEYLEDGVRFWQQYKKHHPFLLPDYSGSGRGYHARFEKIGFTSEHAGQVAFVEVLHLPTCGSGAPPAPLLSVEHLQRLEDWAQCGNARYVFIPPSVIALLHKVGSFRWMPARPTAQVGSLPILYRSKATTVFSPYHFSYRYGSPTVRRQQLIDIGALI